MAKEKFKVALSTLAGSSFPNFLRSVRFGDVDKGYRLRFIAAGLVSLFAEPFRWAEGLRYGIQIRNKKIEQPPIFILGHWRSGTTYLHNLLSQDPQMAYVTTYQGIFPNQLLSAKWVFKSLMKANMPDKRPADNVKLSADFPQEEEFAIGNMNPYSFYNFWFFPRRTIDYLNKYILLKDFSEKQKARWKNDYTWMVRKALINTGRDLFISKNPPHTGRVPVLLEMFPEAKFIHIYRNPITVYLSTLNFFTKTIPPLKFQNFSKLEMEMNILEVYEKMMQKFEADKALIPAGHLVEIRYEDFEGDPLPQLEAIYKQLNIQGFEANKATFKAYIDGQEEFQVNQHKIARAELDRILSRLQRFMDLGGYQVPDNITIVD
jgi:hypothetical protein